MAALLTHWALPVVIATYATVLAQIAFPFLLFHRITRRIAVVILLGMHLSIAVLMGLPFFSGVMASADAVLVSSATWIAIVTWLRTALTDNRLIRAPASRAASSKRTDLRPAESRQSTSDTAPRKIDGEASMSV